MSYIENFVNAVQEFDIRILIYERHGTSYLKIKSMMHKWSIFIAVPNFCEDSGSIWDISSNIIRNSTFANHDCP